MTAICPGGGSSSPNLNSAIVANYSAGLLAEYLLTVEAGWLIPVIPLLGLADIVLSNFCGTDPPAVPTFTAAEANALLHVQLGADFDSGLPKFRDLVLNTIWQQNCHCNSGTATPSPIVTMPPTAVVIQPPTPGNTLPCLTDRQTGTSTGIGGFAGPDRHVAGMNVTFVRMTCSSVVPAGVTGSSNCGIQMANAAGTLIVNMNQASTHADNGVVFVKEQFVTGVPADADIVYNMVPPTAGSTFDIKMELWCNGNTPTTVQTPCCPPDPSTQAYLDLILKGVTLIQRQSVPFAYVYGADHPGLTGNGTLSVSGLIGVSVDVTTLPNSLGREDGMPVEYFDVGFITFGTADGWVTSRRIDHDGSLLLPPSSGVFTQVGYTLHPGVVASIRELVREP